jgi:ELWxxDGT repeat protein
MRRLAFAVLVSLIAPVALRAQAPYLIKDINTSNNAAPSSSGPNSFIRFGSRVFFSATINFQPQLWATDGTEAGTAMVTNVFSQVSPSQFIVLNGKLLFNARDSSHGEELWVSDGTTAGTKLLADISTGSRSSFPRWTFAVVPFLSAPPRIVARPMVAVIFEVCVMGKKFASPR